MHLRCSPPPKTTLVGIWEEIEGKHDPSLTTHGDGPAILVSICHYHDWLFKYLLCALQACKKKNPWFKRQCAVLCYTATTQRPPGTGSSHLWAKCREMNYLPTWLGAKHEGASPCLLLLWTSHPTQWGKTALVRSSNKHNASPAGSKLQFSWNKEEKWSFFFGWQILSKVLWGAAQLHTAIYRKMMHCDQSPYSPG